MIKPRAFVGSSVENLAIAYELQENLEYDAEITVWSQGLFAPSTYTLDALVDALANFDFAIFVFAPDDIVKIRNKEYQSIRDNVVFELGLFVGKLGKDRCFMVTPRGAEDFHLPTDLSGLTPATFDPNRQDKNLNAALGPACNKIRKVIQNLGIFQARLQTTSSHAESALNVYKVSLQAWNGHYVSAENGGGGEVLANRNEVDEWTTFDLIELKDNYIGLRAQSGDFLCAEGGGGLEVIASRTKLGDWETFKLDKLEDDRVHLRAHIGQYVSVEDDERGVVVARRGAPHERTIFRLIKHSKP